MLRITGYGDNVWSGLPDIVNTWKKYGHGQPKLDEDMVPRLVRLVFGLTRKTRLMMQR